MRRLTIVSPADFTGINQKFEHTIISFTCEMFHNSRKFGYHNKVPKVTLCMKHSHSIVHNFFSMLSKIWMNCDTHFPKSVLS